MHFHQWAHCRNCKHVVAYATPLPDILFVGDYCAKCGEPDVIGFDLVTNVECAECEPAMTTRLMWRWQNSLQGWP